MAKTSTKENVVHLPNRRSREVWVKQITDAWQESLPSIFETGNLLESAKAELAYGEWTAMCKDDLPFNRQTAFKLIKIANNDNVRNVSHVKRLPVHWGTLYQLTLLTDEQFEEGIKSKAINPKMRRKDVNELRGVEPKPAKKKDREISHITSHGFHTPIDSCASTVRRIMFETIQQIAATDVARLFAEIRDELSDLEAKTMKREEN